VADRLSALATFVDPDGSRVEAATGSGFSLVFDSPEAGRTRTAPSPIEAQLAVLAACTSYDVASILRKKRQAMQSYQIAVHGDRASQHPLVYTDIQIEHQVRGAVEPEALRRSVELSATRYCPVNAMLSRSVRIEHRYRLIGADGVEHSALVVVTGPGTRQPA
jgi:putative redox protein